jgi:hypothetical protein
VGKIRMRVVARRHEPQRPLRKPSWRGDLRFISVPLARARAVDGGTSIAELRPKNGGRVRMGKEVGEEKIVKKNPRKLKALIVLGASTAVAGVAAWSWTGPSGRSAGVAGGPSAAYERRELRTPLSPALFVGQTARAYEVAHEIPHILDQLYCYCECDKHLGHHSLLSCFIDSHAAT